MTDVYLDNDLSSLSGPYVQQWRVTIATDNVALFVTLASGECDGRFSDNGFHLVDSDKVVRFLSKDYLQEAELRNCISLMSYGNNIP